MRQGSIVTGLLLVVGLPIAFFADGGWDGVRRDVGRVASFQFTAPSMGQATRSTVSVSQGERTAAATAVGGTIAAAATLVRTATGSPKSAPSRSPYLVAPGRNYAAGGVDPDDLNITGGIGGAAHAADVTALRVANIADPKDYGSALKFYALATDPNNAAIRYAIARDYLDTATPNYSIGARWLYTAAELGNAKAALDLSGLYLEGKGVDRNYAQAYAWGTIAARSLTSAVDQSTANDRLNRLLRAMTADERSAAESMIQDWKPVAVLPALAPAPAEAPNPNVVNATG